MSTLTILKKMNENRSESPDSEATAPKKEFTGEVNRWYRTVRHGTSTSIYLTAVKKQTVYYKDRIEDKHQSSMPLARFLKFYNV